MLQSRFDSQPHCATRLDLCLRDDSSSSCISPSYRLGRSRIRVQVPRDQQRRYLAGSARCEADGGSHVATPRSLSHIMASSIAILQEEFGAIPTDEKTTSVTFQDMGKKKFSLRHCCHHRGSLQLIVPSDMVGQHHIPDAK